jgi:hypothetical protein
LVAHPRDLAKEAKLPRTIWNYLSWFFFDKFYLLMEMLNLLDEKSRNVFLSDGGHIENLGVAVGRIVYRHGEEGIIVYFKSSLTGDEKDYVLDYKKRHPAFPHETTGDQFFSEEQVEVYRALGFHAVDGFFDDNDKDDFACLDRRKGGWPIRTRPTLT